MSWESLFNGVVLDSETTSLRRTSGHAFALKDIGSPRVREWLFDPYRVENYSPLQDQAQARDLGQHRLLRTDYNDWLSVLADEYQSAPEGVLEKIKSQAGFIHRRVTGDEWQYLLQGQTPGQRQQQIASNLAGATVAPEVSRRGIRGFFSGEFLDAVKDKTIWIANAPFEASLVGNIMSGERDAEGLQRFKNAFETQTNVASQLYVTGVEVQNARVAAQVSGDWRGVWRSYVAGAGKAGTKVRDIQDVLRAMTSYGRAQGMIKTSDVYWGTQMDVSGRLWASLDDPLGWNRGEVHAAAEDTVWEEHVLRNTLETTDALAAAETHGLQGLSAEQQRALGRGRLYLKRLEALQEPLRARSMVQRLERGALDLLDQGVTTVTTDRRLATNKRTVGVYGGGTAEIDRLDFQYRNLRNLDDLALIMAREGKYDPQALAGVTQRMKLLMSEGREHVQAYSAGAVQKLDEIMFNPVRAENLDRPIRMSELGLDLAQAPKLFRAPVHVPEKLPFRMRAANAIPGFLGVAAGLALAGATLGSRRGEESGGSLLSPTYEQWLLRANAESQIEEYEKSQPAPERAPGIPGRGYPDPATAQARWNRWDGMGHGGVAGATRSYNTDFGSPYKGPQVSEQVIFDADERRRREDWMLNQWGIRRHSAHDRDFWTPFFNWRSKLGFAAPQGYSFISGGAPAQNYQSMRSEKLREIDLSHGWNVEVEDADTVKLRRSGFFASILNFMGLEPNYQIRVVGADSPEIQHGPKEGQVWGQRATEVGRSLLGGGKSVKLLYDPESASYGRTVGTFIVDGQNYTQELIKRGAAGWLPYGKESESVIDFEGMKAVEDRARLAGRGMWSTPYFQAIRQFDPQNQVTFHSYVHEDRRAGSSFLATAHFTALAAQRGERVDVAAAARTARAGMSDMELAKATKDGDRVRLPKFDVSTLQSGSMLLQQSRQAAAMNRTRGTAVKAASQRQHAYGKLSGYEKLDSQGESTSPFSHRAAEAYSRYEADKENRKWRREHMREDERQALNMIYGTYTNHHRMGT